MSATAPAAGEIAICRGPDCARRRGGEGLWEAFSRAVAVAGAGATWTLRAQACFGRCSHGPMVLVRAAADPAAGRSPAAPPVALYTGVLDRHVAEIVAQHVRRDGSDPAPPATE